MIGKVTFHEGRTIVTMDEMSGKMDVTMSDGERVNADHVLLATGYKPDIKKLTMLHQSLLADTKTNAGVPLLGRYFESSVPGLYFVGLTSVRAFGPAQRFVVGCRAAAQRVALSVARRRIGLRRGVARAH